jgi:sugar lactone lactonase YvrE
MGVFIGGGGSRGKVSADGMTVDKHGNVFIAVPSGVKVFTGAGEQVKHIETPVNITNCVVGGDEDQYLFMTGHKQIFRCALHYSEN